MDRKNFLILLVCTVIAAFFGAFLASYITEKPKSVPIRFIKHQQRPLMPGAFENAIEQQEKMFEHDMEFFDKFDSDMENLIEQSPNTAGFIQMSNSGLKMVETPNEYKITMNLKPFGNDVKNVVVKTKGKMVKISAGYESKDKKDYNSSQFYQVITLPGKVKADSIKKVQKGDVLTITIPKK